MQLELLEGLAQNFATDEYRLLIIDSIMSLYRSDFIGRGELSERQSALNAFLRRATQMAEEFNLVVFMVGFLSPNQRSRLTLSRPIRSCRIQEQVPFLPELMGVSLLEDIFLHMHRQPESFFEKVVERNVLPKL
ncbi:hypothetical protein OCU04_011186 [Sclerotinia nivalis]|uniref:RecA family profile 1 domain-containing protein n=1 Tax=Sclerotinia nivalis TaxID=352851 RepID=A0A9X0AC86_9HELO|nr:hypothetical protein OCU04_011186 [Sclerotinia nivalis]